MNQNKKCQDRTKRPYVKSTRSPSPKTMEIDMDNENSPLPIACTQETNENVDVVWDWNSPQAKRHPRKCQKRLLVQSPKVPLKRHPSSSSAQDLEKLREELQRLKNELAVPDHEESLQLSPVEEAAYKTFTPIEEGPAQEFHDFEIGDFMDDGLNEQLFAFSQQVEDNLQSDNKFSPVRDAQTPVSKLNFKHTTPKEKLLANDSFDDLLQNIDMETLTQTSDSGDFQTNDDMYSSSQKIISTSSGKMEFYRTKSFEMANNINSESVPKKCTQEEVEYKRKLALAKLESKRKADKVLSPTKCSLQQIEEKRLQALAKIESKKQQEIIEKKRQEALKRLELRQQKNAIMVKSSLVSRLK
ncbi:uncharacterized protein LOC126883198 isoform X1 [Diabrotica virgifera virgifera]|uniref:Uncharacterized protein n=1 Tax=Diabrotica virgifera virgifera TaxID=50390 RepID=A0ABM5K2J3_DIAVI|nr:uncharacterized protein LOC126883198 isoform X1 [Diabrotica virgifera virgifera]